MAVPKFEGLYVSISQIKTYLRCPRQFQLRYIKGLKPAFVPLALAFGSAIHEALAEYYKTIKTAGMRPPLEDILNVFSDAWLAAQDGPAPLQLEDDDDAVQDHLEKGRRMLSFFYSESLKAPVPQVLAVEEPFSVPLHDSSTGEVLEEHLVGVFDLVTQEQDEVIVTEHKTGAKKWTADQLRFDLQPTTYRVAARELGIGDARLRLQLLAKTKNPALHIEELHRDARDERELLETTIGVLRAIDARAFFPLRGWQCKTCPYAGPCGGT